MGLGQIALNRAPGLGGLMLALAAGQFRGPDYRELIKQHMDLLDRLPPEAAERRAELRRTIDSRIDDLIDSADRSRALRKAALSYRGNWRDVVLFLCMLLFTPADPAVGGGGRVRSPWRRARRRYVGARTAWCGEVV